jgi:hypothetical protein
LKGWSYSKKIGDRPKDNIKLAEAIDTYLSMALSKPALKKITARKAYVRWDTKDSVFPVLDRIEVFRYGRGKYLLLAHIVDGAPA